MSWTHKFSSKTAMVFGQCYAVPGFKAGLPKYLRFYKVPTVNLRVLYTRRYWYSG